MPPNEAAGFESPGPLAGGSGEQDGDDASEQEGQCSAPVVEGETEEGLGGAGSEAQ